MADIARMNDVVDTSKASDGLSPHKTMGIRDDADLQNRGRRAASDSTVSGLTTVHFSSVRANRPNFNLPGSCLHS